MQKSTPVALLFIGLRAHAASRNIPSVVVGPNGLRELFVSRCASTSAAGRYIPFNCRIFSGFAARVGSRFAAAASSASWSRAWRMERESQVKFCSLHVGAVSIFCLKASSTSAVGMSRTLLSTTRGP